jgi:hypothetical protein
MKNRNGLPFYGCWLVIHVQTHASQSIISIQLRPIHKHTVCKHSFYVFFQCYILKFDARSEPGTWILQSVRIKSTQKDHVTIDYYPPLKVFTSSTDGTSFQRLN